MPESPGATLEDPIAPAAPTPVSVSFAAALRFWVKLGFISFGGPAGQIAIMHRELVDRRRWISEARFLHALNFCMLLPGPEAQQLATYVGWLLHRTRGGLVAGAMFVIPSIFVLMGLSYVYAAYGERTTVAAVLAGFKPVVVAIVVEAVFRIGKRALRSRLHVSIAVAAFVAIYILHVSFPLIVLGAGLVGLLSSRFRFTAPKPGQASQAATREHASAHVLDDDSPLPTHALRSPARTFATLALGLALWVVPFVVLGVWRGWSSLHQAEYVFFTRAAFVTFGGAYAVLAYVAQSAAGASGWLTFAETVDGLALAETTPGPLVMVLQFVGYMAAWHRPEGMSPVWSAFVGALVTTYATFLPCFVLIFVGAPYIEALRGNRSLTSALAAVTAAVVGVILNLALVFGGAVILPHGIAGGVDGFAVGIGFAAFVALARYKVDILWIILAGGLAGSGRVLVALI